MVRRRRAVARVAGRQAAVVAAGDRLAQIWATRASDGLERAPNGLGWARALHVVVPSGGGGADAGGIGMAARPACCSRAVRALRVRLDPAGPVWVWCVLTTLSDRRSQLGGGGGLLWHGCRAAVLVLTVSCTTIF
jgi:hypothetical protein